LEILSACRLSIGYSLNLLLQCHLKAFEDPDKGASLIR
jgi:hypothetical protein